MKDHPLKGNWADHRECHIAGDFLLISRLGGNVILFVRAGTHSELFEDLIRPFRTKTGRDPKMSFSSQKPYQVFFEGLSIEKIDRLLLT